MLHILEYLLIFVRFLLLELMLRSVDFDLVDSHLILVDDDVRFVSEVVLRRLKCTFYLMYTYNVRHVDEVDIIMKPFRFSLSEKISHKYSL